jgi:hypothetical protein
MPFGSQFKRVVQMRVTMEKQSKPRASGSGDLYHPLACFCFL